MIFLILIFNEKWDQIFQYFSDFCLYLYLNFKFCLSCTLCYSCWQYNDWKKLILKNKYNTTHWDFDCQAISNNIKASICCYSSICSVPIQICAVRETNLFLTINPSFHIHNSVNITLVVTNRNVFPHPL